MRINLIVAMDKNRLIGEKGKMSWHIPSELKYFKERTMGGTLVMGRKTFESLPTVLPNRVHIVLTTSKIEVPEHAESKVFVVSSVDKLIELLRKFPHLQSNLFVIGGAQIYQQLAPYCHKFYITIIDHKFPIGEHSTFFPLLATLSTRVIHMETHYDKTSGYHYTTVIVENLDVDSFIE